MFSCQGLFRPEWEKSGRWGEGGGSHRETGTTLLSRCIPISGGHEGEGEEDEDGGEEDRRRRGEEEYLTVGRAWGGFRPGFLVFQVHALMGSL